MNLRDQRRSTRGPARFAALMAIALFCAASCGRDQSSDTSQSDPYASPNSGSGGCQGQNFDRSRQIIEIAWLGGLQIADYMFRTDDTIGGMNQLITLSNDLNAEAGKLPMACQALIRTWSDQIGQAFGGGGGYGGGTQCSGGVCCDNTGCY